MVTANAIWRHDFETGEIVTENIPPLSWTAKGLAATLAKAAEFGTDPALAVKARLRFIAERIAELERKLWGCERTAERLGTGPNPLRSVTDFRRRVQESALLDKFGTLQKERNSLQYEQESLKGFFQPTLPNSRLTESQIEAASNYPIDQLFDGVKGNMVCCPFHADKSPSASIKNNRLTCFAGCRPKNGDKASWGPISLLMERDGLRFPAAVRRLAA